jgi:mRNA interferase MazF
MYKQGEIVLVPFPYTDLNVTKKRPAVIISNEKVNKTEDVICCLITTRPRNEDLSIENNDLEMGELPYKSFVRMHKIFTINKKLIIRKLCKINNGFIDEVFNGIVKYIKRL